MKKIKVAEFFGEPLNYGGQEAFILNVYSKINKEKFNFTFITPFECTNIKLKEMIKENNDKLIFKNKNFDSKMRKKHIIKTAKSTLSNEYDVIHIHSGSIFTLYNVAKIAKNIGIKKVIVHSHATGKNNIKYKMIKILSDINIGKYVDYYFACSELAGKWKFPKKIIESKKFYVIRNGIDLEKFKFNKEDRYEVRRSNALDENNLVFINVGRLSIEKNQLFILDLFKNIKNKYNNSILFLIGEGPLKEKIYSKVKELNLDDSVFLKGNKEDVYRYMSASDIFLFPSEYEGLGLVAIESQTNGLPIICSENIPNEANVSDIFFSINGNLSINNWINKIDKILKIELDRESYMEKVKDKNYDVCGTVSKIEKIYIDRAKENEK